jgi:hypothetical protein
MGGAHCSAHVISAEMAQALAVGTLVPVTSMVSVVHFQVAALVPRCLTIYENATFVSSHKCLVPHIFSKRLTLDSEAMAFPFLILAPHLSSLPRESEAHLVQST